MAEPASPSAELALEQVAAAVSYLRIQVGATSGGADEQHWIACHALLDDPAELAAVAASTAAGRGTEAADVALSLFVQAYAFRIAATAIGTWLCQDLVVDVAPVSTAIALRRHRPGAVRLDEAKTVALDSTPATLQHHLVDGHLAALVATARQATRIGEKLLWSNIGAACASALGAFMDPLAAQQDRVRERAERFFASGRPELSGAGRVVRVGPLWAWERSACCLWYKTSSGSRCSDCSLWSDEERQQRYRQVLADLDAAEADG